MKLFSFGHRGYSRRRKWVALTIWAAVLALVLGMVSFIYDRYRDKERLAEVAKLPDHSAPTEITEPPQTEEATEATRAFAPDFVVYDEMGNPVTLADFQGQPVVLSFWVSWKNECREQMPILQAVYNDYKDKVHFLIINVPDGKRETRESAEAFLEERGFTFPVYYDDDAVAQVNYELQNMPSTYFIDAEGRAMGYAGAYMNRHIFETGLSQCYHD